MCLFLILLIIVPTLELYLLIAIGQKLGIMETIFLIIVTGITGSILMQSEGWRTWKNFKEEIKEKRLPGKRIMDGFLILAGGALLIMPGILTDILGLLLLFPLTRILFREMLIRYIKNKILKNPIQFHANFTVYSNNPNIITVYPESSETTINIQDSQENLRRLEKDARFDERTESSS